MPYARPPEPPPRRDRRLAHADLETRRHLRQRRGRARSCAPRRVGLWQCAQLMSSHVRARSSSVPVVGSSNTGASGHAIGSAGAPASQPRSISSWSWFAPRPARRFRWRALGPIGVDDVVVLGVAVLALVLVRHHVAVRALRCRRRGSTTRRSSAPATRASRRRSPDRRRTTRRSSSPARRMRIRVSSRRRGPAPARDDRRGTRTSSRSARRRGSRTSRCRATAWSAPGGTHTKRSFIV